MKPLVPLYTYFFIPIIEYTLEKRLKELTDKWRREDATEEKIKERNLFAEKSIPREIAVNRKRRTEYHTIKNLYENKWGSFADLCVLKLGVSTMRKKLS